jgi:hypothetical protein
VRIAHDSAETLAIFTRPSWLVMFVGVVMIALAGVLAVVPAKATTLHCSRAGGYPVCELVEDRLWGSYKLARMPLSYMRGAEAAPHAIGGGDMRYYRLNFAIDDGFEGPYYFAWYGSQESAERDVDTFNAFLEDTAAREVTIRNDKRWPYAFVAGLLGFVGLVFVFWGSHRLRVTFSRTDGRVRVTRSGLLGTHQRDFPMDAIDRLEVAGLRGDCQLYLVLRSGDRIDLSTSTDTEGLVGPRRVRESRLKDADRLRTYCDVPQA